MCEWASLLYYVAMVCMKKGKCGRFDEIVSDLDESEEEGARPRDEETLGSMEMVRLACKLDGRLREAEVTGL